MRKWFYAGLLMLSFSILKAGGVEIVLSDRIELSSSEIEKAEKQYPFNFMEESKLVYASHNFLPFWLASRKQYWVKTVFPVPQNIASDIEIFRSNKIGFSSGSFDGLLNKNGEELINFIRLVESHGLNPEDYHCSEINRLLGKFRPFVNCSPNDLVRIELLLTDAFIALSKHLYYGMAIDRKIKSNWLMREKSGALCFEGKIKEAQRLGSVKTILNLLCPRDVGYGFLKDELVFFKGLTHKDWPRIPSGIKIKPGDTNETIPLVRKILKWLRYPVSDSISGQYDSLLEKQLIRFQADHGIEADGIVDKMTISALNINPGERVGQLKVNMERLRWITTQTTEKQIVVNIPDFSLVLMKHRDTLIALKAVVGTKVRPTPVFDAQMTYIVFNPTWTLPPTVLENDVIPELLKGPGYIDRKKMKIFRSNGTPIGYSEIDWSKISKNYFPYAIRQEPGGANALGRIKFMFPNPHSIYIHDTPTKWSFARSDRTFSSGCIRVEKPIELAEVILSEIPGWGREKITSLIQQGQPYTVHIAPTICVQIIYLTAWCNSQGRVQFRNDVYNLDQLVLKGLLKKA